jgi:hypothetical protein
MLDRYDPRSDDARDRGHCGDRSQGGRGAGDSQDVRDCDPNDVFTRDLDLPLGRGREHVLVRDRVYQIGGDESRTLATVGAFRVVSERDLHEMHDDAGTSRQCLRHLEDEGCLESRCPQVA